MVNQTTPLTLNQEVLNQWIGQYKEKKDHIDARPANFLSATLNQDRREYVEGDILPPGWHWLYFLEAPEMSQLGYDGHAALGDFMPPVALPKRMWAGSRIKFHSPLLIGETIIKTSVIKSIIRKSGSTGELCFVTVNHRLFSRSTLKLEEDQDIVYRGNTPSNAPEKPSLPAPEDADHSIIIQPTSTLLFRYSALTFNGHRIHYDLDFCQRVEGYPALVVHAPLTATLMLELVQSCYRDITHNQHFTEFNLKAVSPLFNDAPFSIHLKELEGYCKIWASNVDGNTAMSATLHDTDRSDKRKHSTQMETP